jgi:hypothetical protein
VCGPPWTVLHGQAMFGPLDEDESCYITLHYITLHYITLHYITLHYITLHYITIIIQLTPQIATEDISSSGLIKQNFDECFNNAITKTEYST